MFELFFGRLLLWRFVSYTESRTNVNLNVYRVEISKQIDIFSNSSQQVMEKRENWIKKKKLSLLFYYFLSFLLFHLLWLCWRLLFAMHLIYGRKRREFFLVCCNRIGILHLWSLINNEHTKATGWKIFSCIVVDLPSAAYKLSWFSWFHLLMASPQHVRESLCLWFESTTAHCWNSHSFLYIFLRGGQMSWYPAERMPCKAPISLNESINNAICWSRWGERRRERPTFFKLYKNVGWRI